MTNSSKYIFAGIFVKLLPRIKKTPDLWLDIKSLKQLYNEHFGPDQI
jgi:hypothetical protein